MNLIEALKSGKRHRRISARDWHQTLESYTYTEILSEWEIEEPTMTITKTQFWEAAKNVFGTENCGFVIKYNGSAEIVTKVNRLAKELGLE